MTAICLITNEIIALAGAQTSWPEESGHSASGQKSQSIHQDPLKWLHHLNAIGFIFSLRLLWF